MKKSLTSALFFLGLLALGKPSQAQTISTIAGTGTAGFSGDGGPATAADMNIPHGLVTDAAGNIYFSDASNYRIRKINTSGIITTIAGTGSAGFSGDGGPATAAALNTPFSVAMDAGGNFYFCDISNHRVRKINTSGIITTIAGDGVPSTTGDGGPATAAEVNNPSGICVDPSGNVYFVENHGEVVRKINTSGVISTIAGTVGTLGYTGDGGAATAATFHNPNYLSIDGTGNLYVSDNGNHAIRKINTSGIISTFAGGTAGFAGDGGQATAASLYFPAGTVADRSGNFYIADYNNHAIRKVDASGIITTIAGIGGTAGFSGDGGPATAATLNFPVEIAYSSTGYFLIADSDNQRLRKFTTVNLPPHFMSSLQPLPVCKDSAAKPINLLLAVIDSDAGQIVTWSVATPPLHGTIGGLSTTAISTASPQSPTGVTYTPATGYVGMDSFTVKIGDGIDSAKTKIIVTVTDCHLGVPTIAYAANVISITPNPTNGSFSLTVAAPGAGNAEVTITNITGQKVKTLTVPTNTSTLLTLNEPTGAYFISAATYYGITQSKIIIVK